MHIIKIQLGNRLISGTVLIDVSEARNIYNINVGDFTSLEIGQISQLFITLSSLLKNFGDITEINIVKEVVTEVDNATNIN